MLKKTIRRLGALAMVLAMAVSVFAVNASAVNEEVPATNATVSFTKTIDMSKADGANTPAGTYTFTIDPGTAVAATATTPEIKAGVAGATIAAVDFTYGDAASKTVNVNFDNVTFPTAGIYRYVITETNSSNTDVKVDDTATRYLDVYVVNTNNGPKIKWSVLLKMAETPDKDAKYTTSNKSDGYTNEYTTYSLNLKKIIAGEMADMTETFEFTISFKGPAGASFKYGDSTITLNANGNATLTIPALGHEGTAVIKGIPSTVKYTIAETVKENEGYTTTYTQTDVTDAQSGVTTTEKEMGKKDNSVEFTNTKNASTPGGVIMTIAPYALMVVLAGAFAVVFLTRRNRAE